jgi:hypothetical protein
MNIKLDVIPSFLPVSSDITLTSIVYCGELGISFSQNRFQLL